MKQGGAASDATCAVGQGKWFRAQTVRRLRDSKSLLYVTQGPDLHPNGQSEFSRQT